MRKAPGNGWITVRLMVAVVTIVASSFIPGPAQDWFPFQIAARMAADGQWSALYPPAGATSQFDHSAEYVDHATTAISESVLPAINRDYLTAFISTPPAALLLQPSQHLPWRLTQAGWRLALAVPVALAILWLAASSRDQQARLVRWSWIALVSAPLLLYAVYMGQPSAWLFAAAVVSIGPSTRIGDGLGGLALALGILCKVTPVIAVVLLWLAGRRRLAAIAAVCTATAVLLALPETGLDAWQHFARSTAALGSVVITLWNNASIDAAIMRYFVGTDSSFHTWATGPWLVAQVCRALLLTMAVRTILLGASIERRSAAAWLGWLACTPLLWLHYLLLLGPVVDASKGRLATGALLAFATLPAVLVVRVAGWPTDDHGYILCAAWVSVALLTFYADDRKLVAQ